MQVVERGGVKLLVLGFLYNMDDHCANVEVTHVDAAVRVPPTSSPRSPRVLTSHKRLDDDGGGGGGGGDDDDDRNVLLFKYTAAATRNNVPTMKRNIRWIGLRSSR